MTHRRYKIDLYARGVHATTGSITKTFSSSEIASAPIIGGQILRLDDGVTESVPWTLDIVDRNSTMTGLLANSSGRPHLLGRLVRIRHSLDSTASTAFSSVAVGRLTDVALTNNPAVYRLSVSDERWVERNTDIFTTNNATILPMMGGVGRWRVLAISGNLVALQYVMNTAGSAQTVPRNPDVMQLLRDDLKEEGLSLLTSITAGNFRTLRWRNRATGTDYEVATFDVGLEGTKATFQTYSYTASLDAWLEGQWPRIVLVWAASQPAANTFVNGFLHAPTHAPTDVLPYTVGRAHPFTILQNVYSGSYSASTAVLPRYSTAALATLQAKPYAAVRFRITRSWRMDEFVDRFLYASYATMPVVDSSGKLAPQSVLLPTTSIAPASLPLIGSSNALTHPTMNHASREAVTVLRAFRHTWTSYARGPDGGPVSIPGDVGVDGYRTSPDVPSTFTHDTVTTLGRLVRERYYGVTDYYEAVPSTVPLTEARFRWFIKPFAQLVFDRFGDGPVHADVEVTSGVAVTPGNFVRMSISSYPGVTARGSTRIYQVLGRWPTPRGFRYNLLDVGPNQALTAPTVAIAASTLTTRHALRATIGSIPAGARWILEIGHGATTASTAPTRYNLLGSGTTATTATIVAPLPSRTKFFARVMASRPQRFASAYSAVATAVTASISAPTLQAMSNISGGGARVKWTVGSSSYRTMVMVDASTSATLGSSNCVARVMPGTTRYDLWGLNSNDSHKVGVAHFDPYGGTSPQDTTTFTTSTSYTVAPAMRGITVLLGA